jgi:DNA (cytosine-5)-methyltransferase 1
VVMRGKSQLHPLQRWERPEFEIGDQVIRVADLFCGCGGLTLGLAQAAREQGLGLDIGMAADVEERALDVYRQNFPKAVTFNRRVEEMFDGEIGSCVSDNEREIGRNAGEVHVLLGGPPCQGHSNLNNHTRRDDPKNWLYLRMARAVEVLNPAVVLIENVPAVRHDKAGVVGSTIAALMYLGYQTADSVICLDQLGVAQRRRRHILLATREELPPAYDILQDVLLSQSPNRDLRWAIGDLVAIADPKGWDRPSRASKENLDRMKWLLDNGAYDLPNERRPACHQGDHSYKSMYGRLCWEEPAQTITSGFGSIGQGRYMHPDRPRALTAHEAARLQDFPDYFSFDGVNHRSALATMIGNAVPPALSRSLLGRLVREISL